MYFIQVHYFCDAHVSRKLCKSPSLSPVINNRRKYYLCILFSKYSLNSRIFQIKMFPPVLILPKISKVNERTDLLDTIFLHIKMHQSSNSFFGGGQTLPPQMYSREIQYFSNSVFVP